MLDTIFTNKYKGFPFEIQEDFPRKIQTFYLRNYITVSCKKGDSFGKYRRFLGNYERFSLRDYSDLFSWRIQAIFHREYRYFPWKIQDISSKNADYSLEIQTIFLGKYRRFSLENTDDSPCEIQTIFLGKYRRFSLENTDDSPWKIQTIFLVKYRRFSLENTDDFLWKTQTILLVKYRRFSL